jgi:hypothetical protein
MQTSCSHNRQKPLSAAVRRALATDVRESVRALNAAAERVASLAPNAHKRRLVRGIVELDAATERILRRVLSPDQRPTKRER